MDLDVLVARVFGDEPAAPFWDGWNQLKEESDGLVPGERCDAFLERFRSGGAGWVADYQCWPSYVADKNVCMHDLTPSACMNG